ncbi:fungal-specific transcription factor domain-containing protein [Infundibulicybe gibba]|nr:fungal-specific transcription factor domain-containing protein [Infundibulicybe gibba]
MPPAPKSTSKKPGAPKAKGAVRAKSGCYTCRIRRKKCDEQPNHLGHCQTCVRLRLQCLGFGTKRPEWLRESHNVTELREKIKTFLASQGMIKGHSGSGPRNAEHEPEMLRLQDDYSASSETPPTPQLVLPPDLPPQTDSIRSWPSSSHYSGINHESHYDNGLADGAPYNHTNSLVPSSYQGAAFGSSFSRLSDYSPVGWIDDEYADGAAFPSEPDTYLPNDLTDQLIGHYMTKVLKIQYLLADRGLERIIRGTFRNKFSKEAVRLLASVHWCRFIKPGQSALEHEETQGRYQSLRALLTQRRFSGDDAMAALHVISSFLFDGGHGTWEEWLRVVAGYVESVLKDPSYNGPADALKRCDPKTAFVIKTAIWFDVLASITTQKPPHLLWAIRAMFSPTGEWEASPQFSMMTPMGCENDIVWALAETTNLAWWKQQETDKGRLSVPTLIEKAGKIRATVGSKIGPANIPYSDDLEHSRWLTSNIFRVSTRLYLHCVVSGDHPAVIEIQKCVDEAIFFMSQIPQNTSIARSVTRMTVFGFFICGCLANNDEQRDQIFGQLNHETAEGVGNCNSICNLMKTVWAEHKESGIASGVPWREHLKAAQMLLV